MGQSHLLETTRIPAVGYPMRRSHCSNEKDNDVHGSRALALPGWQRKSFHFHHRGLILRSEIEQMVLDFPGGQRNLWRCSLERGLMCELYESTYRCNGDH